jgi:phosphoglycolate phosphatase
MKHVILFDIDGTLLLSGGAGQVAMERALAKTFGLGELVCDIPAAGRTDRAITTDLFQHVGIESDEARWDAFVACYFELLPVALKELDGSVLPGIRELLDQLAARNDVTLGLLTGNFEEGAWLKLRHYQIDHHFRYGGFGDHHFDRDDVARLAYEATHRHLGRIVEPHDVWVIGDTPSDVRCARAIGARAVAVATGMYSVEDLRACAPDVLFKDFSKPELFLKHLSRDEEHAEPVLGR